jgi:hypothetical protein
MPSISCLSKEKNPACHAFFGSNFLTFFFPANAVDAFFGSNLGSFFRLVQAVFYLRMGRDDEPVDSMEIDSQKQHCCTRGVQR